MKHFLMKAFQGACDTFNRIEPLYQQANIWMARMMTDADFLAVGASKISSRPLRTAAKYYETGQSMGRGQLFDTMHLKASSGDFAPRPIAKLAMVMAYEGVTILPRLVMTYPELTTMTLTTAALTAFAATQSALPDVIATWMGSSPHQRWRMPQTP